MKIVFLLLFTTLSFSALATPQKIEMIFLSQGKVTQLIQQLDKMDAEKMFSMIAQADTYQDNCIPMGEGCFHPQYGYLNKKPVLSGTVAPMTDSKKDEVNLGAQGVGDGPDSEYKLKTFNAVETSLVNCEKGNYFDIYCGQQKAQGKFAEVEIWLDVSSSFRAIDYNKDPNYCNRRTFITKVTESCKDKVNVSIYNTSLKQLGDLSSACLSYGGNDESKLLQWIKDSQAKTLLIVTDVDEMSKGMREFLDSKGAKFIGEMKPFTSTDLANYAKEFSKVCKK
jgi:hypothetical protein